LVATTRRRVTSACGSTRRRCSLQTQPSPVAPGNRLRLHPRAPAEAQIRLLLRVRSEQPQQARLTSGTAIDVCSRSFWAGLHFSLPTLGGCFMPAVSLRAQENAPSYERQAVDDSDSEQPVELPVPGGHWQMGRRHPAEDMPGLGLFYPNHADGAHCRGGARAQGRKPK
jgi:hypothetical protein